MPVPGIADRVPLCSETHWTLDKGLVPSLWNGTLSLTLLVMRGRGGVGVFTWHQCVFKIALHGNRWKVNEIHCNECNMLRGPSSKARIPDTRWIKDDRRGVQFLPNFFRKARTLAYLRKNVAATSASLSCCQEHLEIISFMAQMGCVFGTGDRGVQGSMFWHDRVSSLCPYLI